jgi:hypothetical protein
MALSMEVRAETLSSSSGDAVTAEAFTLLEWKAKAEARTATAAIPVGTANRFAFVTNSLVDGDILLLVAGDDDG